MAIKRILAKVARQRFVSAHGVPRIRSASAELRELKREALRKAPKLRKRVPKLAPLPKKYR